MGQDTEGAPRPSEHRVLHVNSWTLHLSIGGLCPLHVFEHILDNLLFNKHEDFVQHAHRRAHEWSDPQLLTGSLRDYPALPVRDIL